MRLVAVALVTAALGAASSALAAPERSSATWGWRYGHVSGTATMTVTSPRLACTAEADTERRVLRGVYRVSFTGRSMRRFRGGVDIEYSPVAGGPAGNTQPIAFHARRSIEELVHIRTITENEQGEPVCTLAERSCTRTDTPRMRNFGNRLNVWMRPGGRVRVYPPHAVGFGRCAYDAPRSDIVVADTFGRVFPLALFNRPQSILRFASTSKGRGQTESGAPVTGTYVYRAAIGLRRLPGTPRAYCRTC
jgi:hypothetical protein